VGLLQLLVRLLLRVLPLLSVVVRRRAANWLLSCCIVA
jgi:hypothetical protein